MNGGVGGDERSWRECTESHSTALSEQIAPLRETTEKTRTTRERADFTREGRESNFGQSIALWLSEATQSKPERLGDDFRV
jgi:hypothetical protein